MRGWVGLRGVRHLQSIIKCVDPAHTHNPQGVGVGDWVGGGGAERGGGMGGGGAMGG